MHLPHRLRMLSAGTTLIGLIAVLVVAAAPAAQAVRAPAGTVQVRTLRKLADHYRVVTWDFERAAQVRPTPTSFSYRRATDRRYLRWTVQTWTHRADTARRRALAAIHRRLAVTLPKAPGPHSALQSRLAYVRHLTNTLQQIYPGKTSRSLASARPAGGSATLQAWQLQSAEAALAVARHGTRQARIAGWLADDFRCIHRYEGSWDANTGNGYYGGLQMDLEFQHLYGAEFIRRWGTADNWPSWAQLEASARAYGSGRGFNPWPNTARACGLL
ncbi:MAG TPA: hypothetical protein VIJ70_08160 [Gaiellaceae bacterium]